MTEFSHEIVMISGGSLGMGYATARRLGKAGARISICGRRENLLAQAEKNLRGENIEIMALCADVSKEEDVDRWFDETVKRFGPPSILVNNAGVAGKGPLLELDETQWDQTMSVNCRGPFLCTRRAAFYMKQANRGRIIFISSIAGQYYRGGYSLYFASKWALNGFAHSAAKELQPFNIHIHIICPGMTETRFFDAYGARPHPPEKQYVDPDTVAEMVERFCRLPEGVDTNEYSIVPSWQLRNLGLRR
ncbi:MAG: SDR family oxidoreductase [Candidatus Hinthialibacter sp.]